MKRGFHTFRGYSLLDTCSKRALTPSMEDYLEMIYRLSREEGFTRVVELAAALHVQPPSASRMLHRLAKEGLVKYEKYSIIRLTQRGEELGRRLIHRHDVLEQFLHLIGLRDALEDAEKIEHNISDAALEGIERLTAYLTGDPDSLRAWQEHLARNSPSQRPLQNPDAPMSPVR